MAAAGPQSGQEGHTHAGLEGRKRKERRGERKERKFNDGLSKNSQVCEQRTHHSCDEKQRGQERGVCMVCVCV